MILTAQRHDLNFNVALAADAKQLLQLVVERRPATDRPTEHRLVDDETQQRSRTPIVNLLPGQSSRGALFDVRLIEQGPFQLKARSRVVLRLQKHRNRVQTIHTASRKNAGYCPRANSSFNASNNPPASST